MTATDVVVEAFTELAPRYEDSLDRELQACWGLSYKDFVSQLVDIVSVERSGVILDVATGTARIPMSMVSRMDGRSVAVGLDITPAMLKCGLANIKANALNPRIKLVCASAMGMPFADSLFDVVICGFATHHMDVPKMLSEIRRVLKEGGHLVLAEVMAPSFWRTSVANAVLGIAAPLCEIAHMSARVRAEVSAIANIRTAAQWRTILSSFGFGEIKMVAEFAGRRPWYPGALALKATKERRQRSLLMLNSRKAVTR